MKTMKFFSRKKDNVRPTRNGNNIIELSGRNYDDLIVCDAALKFWLSETVEHKIEEMCSFIDTSASDLIRQILFVHLYGRYDLFGLIERQDHTFSLVKKHGFKFCASQVDNEESQDIDLTLEVPEKNIADIKVWVPQRMKEDLVRLANQSGMRLSVYARGVIVTHLFGHVPPDDFPVMSPPSDDNEDEENQ